MPEAEEVFDLLLYRPLAFVFVKIVYRFPITPNQITFGSMLLGIGAGWSFAKGSYTAYICGGWLYAAANVLDCADGQLARLQHSGTLFGRVVDGVADYVASVAIFLGLGFGLQAAGNPQWLFVVAAGCSGALHAMVFDQYQSEFISIVRGERMFLSQEMTKFSEELERLKGGGTGRIKIVALTLYLKYLKIQERWNGMREPSSANPDAYRRTNRHMIRLWSFLGPTTNRTLLIAASFAGRIDLYLWIVVVAGNMWLAILSLAQRRVDGSR